jgi:hypothetical protein
MAQATHKRINISVPITKVEGEARKVFGWASVVEKNGQPVIDLQDDIISVADIEKAAYDFVLNVRKAGEMHTNLSGVGRLCESMVFTAEKQAALGITMAKVGWWVGFHIDDDGVWEKVKDGTYKAFSIGGLAERVEA